MDYALYMRGLAYFAGQHSWYHRLFNVDLAERPPKNVQESFSVFSQLVQRFPDSAYAIDARQRMVFLRNRLADYELLRGPLLPGARRVAGGRQPGQVRHRAVRRVARGQRGAAASWCSPTTSWA